MQEAANKFLEKENKEVKSKTWKLNEFNNTFIHQTLRRNMSHLFSDL